MVISEEALEANDLITEVFQKYQQLILKQQPSSNQSELESFLIPNVTAQVPKSQNTMDELSEIFSNQSNETGTLLTSTTEASADLLQPTLTTSADVNLDSQGKHLST